MIEFGMLCYIIYSDQSDDADFCEMADHILQRYKNNLLQIPLTEEYILPHPPPESAEDGEINPEPEEFEVVKEEPRENDGGPEPGTPMYEDISSASDESDTESDKSDNEGRTYQLIRVCPNCQEPMEMAEVPEKMKVRMPFSPKSL
jgi:hypothetical protein